MEKISCSSRSTAICCTLCSARSTVAIKSLINVPVYISATSNFLDSYHGTRYGSFQLSAVSYQFSFPPSGSSSAWVLLTNPEGPARHYSCAGNSGRFSGAKLFYMGTAAPGCPASAARVPKPFPPPLTSRSSTADCDRSLLQLPSPVFWLAH